MSGTHLPVRAAVAAGITTANAAISAAMERGAEKEALRLIEVKMSSFTTKGAKKSWFARWVLSARPSPPSAPAPHPALSVRSILHHATGRQISRRIGGPAVRRSDGRTEGQTGTTHRMHTAPPLVLLLRCAPTCSIPQAQRALYIRHLRAQKAANNASQSSAAHQRMNGSTPPPAASPARLTFPEANSPYARRCSRPPSAPHIMSGAASLPQTSKS